METVGGESVARGARGDGRAVARVLHQERGSLDEQRRAAARRRWQKTATAAEASPLARAATPAPAASHRRVNASGGGSGTSRNRSTASSWSRGRKVGKQPGRARGVRWWAPAQSAMRDVSDSNARNSSSLNLARSRRAQHCHRASSTGHAPSPGPFCLAPSRPSFADRARSTSRVRLGVAFRVFAVRLASTADGRLLLRQVLNKGNKRISKAFLGATAKEKLTPRASPRRRHPG